MHCSHLRFALGFVVALALATMTHAATVTWSAPGNIIGDADVNTTGVLVAARNISQTQVSATVNGVFFDIFPVPNNTNAQVGIPGVANFGIFDLESADTAYGSASAPFSSLSASYQTILASGAGSSTGQTLSLTLLNLTNGAPYLIQLWSNDSDGNFGGVNSTTASAGNSVTLDENTSNAVGGLGQWVTGTFVATGTSQVISLSGPRPELNAFQLRTIPEPGTLVLAAIGGLSLVGLGLARKRITAPLRSQT